MLLVLFSVQCTCTLSDDHLLYICVYTRAKLYVEFINSIVLHTSRYFDSFIYIFAHDIYFFLVIVCTLIEVLMDAGCLVNLYKLQVLTFFH